MPVVRGLAGGRTLLLIDDARIVAERRAGPSATFVDPLTRLHRSSRAVPAPSRMDRTLSAASFICARATRRRRTRISLRRVERVRRMCRHGVRPRCRPTCSAARCWRPCTDEPRRTAKMANGDEIDNSRYRDRGAMLRYVRDGDWGRLRPGVMSSVARDVGAPTSDTVLTVYPDERATLATVGLDFQPEHMVRRGTPRVARLVLDHHQPHAHDRHRERDGEGARRVVPTLGRARDRPLAHRDRRRLRQPLQCARTGLDRRRRPLQHRSLRLARMEHAASAVLRRASGRAHHAQSRRFLRRPIDERRRAVGIRGRHHGSVPRDHRDVAGGQRLSRAVAFGSLLPRHQWPRASSPEIRISSRSAACSSTARSAGRDRARAWRCRNDYEIRNLVERFRDGADFFFRNRGKAQIRGAELEIGTRLRSNSIFSSAPLSPAVRMPIQAPPRRHRALTSGFASDGPRHALRHS